MPGPVPKQEIHLEKRKRYTQPEQASKVPGQAVEPCNVLYACPRRQQEKLEGTGWPEETTPSAVLHDSSTWEVQGTGKEKGGQHRPHPKVLLPVPGLLFILHSVAECHHKATRDKNEGRDILHKRVWQPAILMTKIICQVHVHHTELGQQAQAVEVVQDWGHVQGLVSLFNTPRPVRQGSSA